MAKSPNLTCDCKANRCVLIQTNKKSNFRFQVCSFNILTDINNFLANRANLQSQKMCYKLSHPHVIEGDPNFAVEVVAEERDLSVTLTEVIQNDELGFHLHTDIDRLRRSARVTVTNTVNDTNIISDA